MPWGSSRESRTLYFDIENRPLSYAGNDWTTAEITVASWKWGGEDRIFTKTLEPYPHHRDSATAMLSLLSAAIESSDLVVGHYVRKHDLPMVNGHLMEYSMYPLQSVLVSDTCLDLAKKKDMSRSLASLAALYDLREQKLDISQQDWRDGNRLIPEAVAKIVERCESDVRVLENLHGILLRSGHLRAPKVWTP